MAARRLRLPVSLVLAFVVVAMLVPVHASGAGHRPSAGKARDAVAAPRLPDLRRCGSGAGRLGYRGILVACRDVLQRYGERTARWATTERGRSSDVPSAARGVSPVECPRDAFDGAICGRVDVPVDRSSVGTGTISIAFELYEHTEPGPAESAMLVNFGGPGPGTTPSRGGAFFLLGRNLDTHDLLLIDDRGRGYSDPIDCPKLQATIGTVAEAVGECGAILGSAAGRYGTGDIAMDTEDVRAALGYDLIDYYGVSYGGADVSAYATRYPEHVRSLILDAPWGDTQIRRLLVQASLFARSSVDLIETLCRRSPSCRPERSDPVADFDGLIERIRQRPVRGFGVDAYGERIPVTIDPRFVLEYLFYPYGPFASNGEIAAAAVALEAGDRRPLLRLAAEYYYPLCCLDPATAEGPPLEITSNGATMATFCVDNEWEWAWTADTTQRLDQLKAATEAADPEPFLPFTVAEAAGASFNFTSQCLHWPNPGQPSPIVQPGSGYPDVPTIVMGGDLDNIVPMQQTRWVAELFPGSTLVEVRSAGHGAAFWGPCTANLVTRLIDSLEVGNTSCASRPQAFVPSVGEFPIVAAQAAPARPDPGGGNEADARVRRIATVVASAVKDAIARAELAFFGPGEVQTRGLRGGQIEFLFRGKNGFDWRMNLTGVRFSRDVAVTGHIHWGTSPEIRARLEVRGAARGSLSISTPGYLIDRWFEVRGRLDGQRVAVIVPQT
jgi:pimeloyl-ACP methyl ester carboxylesterase